jgi:hypothetical protein
MKVAVVIIIVLLPIAGTLFVLLGQTTDPIVNLGDKAVTLTVYAGGHPGKVVSVASECPVVALINTLLLEKRGKWKKNFVTYAPVIMLRGEKFSINCQQDRIIINFEKRPGKTVQVVTSLTTEEYSKIEDAAAKLSKEKSK